MTEETPLFVWLISLVAYALWPASGKRIGRVLFANMLIFGSYEATLARLHRWELQRFWAYVEECERSGAEVCPAGIPAFDPPPPVTYWEWAAAAHSALLLALYMYVLKGRTTY